MVIRNSCPHTQLPPIKSAIPKRKAKNSNGTAQPVSSDASTSNKKPKSNNNLSNANSGAPSKAVMDALRQENEELKKQLAESNKMVDRFQEDFAKLQNLRLTAPEQSLREYIMKAEEREKRTPPSCCLFFGTLTPTIELIEQNQMLVDNVPILERLLRPHESGTITLLTREETDGKLLGYKNEITQLRTQVENLKQELKSVSKSLTNTQVELDEEIKRSQSLSQQLSDRPVKRGIESATGKEKEKELVMNQLKLAFYEDLTTIKVHNTKQFSPTTLYFKLHMYKTPAIIDGEPDPNTLVDTVRYFPIGLENEKDDEFLKGLGILVEPFTFVKEHGPFDRQMWEFCMEINNGVTRWRDGGDEEEEEDEEEVEAIDRDDEAIIVEEDD
ncbi:hypothetical protein RHS01_02411 [Rhizoctonia solani]|uniref:Uncharacterized protein n=1 Tax=Rhizoctonia solani TaxID=456999 RepID=A0A8H7IJ41_9AGAM|nr:hypothetical protein RHS01_02411 [Rhizoctonia solani]